MRTALEPPSRAAVQRAPVSSLSLDRHRRGIGWSFAQAPQGNSARIRHHVGGGPLDRIANAMFVVGDEAAGLRPIEQGFGAHVVEIGACGAPRNANSRLE